MIDEKKGPTIGVDPRPGTYVSVASLPYAYTRDEDRARDLGQYRDDLRERVRVGMLTMVDAVRLYHERLVYEEMAAGYESPSGWNGFAESPINNIRKEYERIADALRGNTVRMMSPSFEPEPPKPARATSRFQVLDFRATP